MLHSIAFSVTFPPSEIAPQGRSITHAINFDHGMTAITGPNEVGKSTVLEFTNWALFGVDALRGVSDDYKNAKVALRFSVKGTRYLVKRTITSAELYYDGEGEPLVKGTKAVNLKIVEIFGYGFKVYSVSNAVLQGELVSFGRMLPSERKRLIDSTIGLNVIDSLIEWVNTQGNNAQAEADAIGKVLVAPIAPVRPGDYDDSNLLRIDAVNADGLIKEKNTILGFLSSEKVEPIKPECTVSNTAADLKLLMDHRATVLAGLNKMTAEYNAIPEAKHTKEELDYVEALWVKRDLWLERVKFDKSYKKPTMTRMEIGEHRAALSISEAQMKRDRERISLDKYKEQTKQSCPKCEHEWHLDEAAVKKMEDTFKETYGHLPDELIATCYSKDQLDSLERGILSWEAVAATHDRVKDAVEVSEPSASRATVASERNALAQAERKIALRLSIDTTVVPDDVTEMYHTRLTYEASAVAYEKALAEYVEWSGQVTQKKARLAEIGEPVADWDRVSRSSTYELALTNFALAEGRYNDALADKVAKETEATEYKNSVKALRELKLRIKMFLLPSLNKVASYLLQQMTGGVRRTIKVDEEFNISVDGQRLETLSGSGKSVANLAVRIGLGQVLTNKTFSVLMADEIDADMDQDRAGFTAEALRALSKSIGQIILVSHKRPDADHYIELGK